MASNNQDKVSEKLQVVIFQELLSRPGNRECADCRDKNPSWVSIDFGVFLCMRCSGMHRGLGPSVTRVRSIKLDSSFKMDQLEILANVGNTIANEYWEYNIPSYHKKINLHSSAEECNRYINDKYVRKLFTPSNTKNPVQKYLEAKEKGQNPGENLIECIEKKNQKKKEAPVVEKVEIQTPRAVQNNNNQPAGVKDLLSGDDGDSQMFTEFETAQPTTTTKQPTNFFPSNDTKALQDPKNQTKDKPDILSLYSGNTGNQFSQQMLVNPGIMGYPQNPYMMNPAAIGMNTIGVMGPMNNIYGYQMNAVGGVASGYSNQIPGYNPIINAVNMNAYAAGMNYGYQGMNGMYPVQQQYQNMMDMRGPLTPTGADNKNIDISSLYNQAKPTFRLQLI